MKISALLVVSLLVLNTSAFAAGKKGSGSAGGGSYGSGSQGSSGGGSGSAGSAGSGYGRGAAGHKMAGCGLGSMVVEDGSKWAQVAAAFLNGTGVQTFGITTGTSNCTEDGVATASREKDAFIEANYTDLRKDIAVGSGAYISSLGSLYGCKGESNVKFSKGLQKHAGKVLDASAEQASQLINEVVLAQGLACQG